MRGKGTEPVGIRADVGITPAYAGKRRNENAGRKKGKDHPRLCGEKQLHKLFKLHLLGSPPPMRGKELLLKIDFQRRRITPAYAGKSSISCSTSCVQ